ncbi:MAG TPA: DUF3093 domain-containing protein [Actinocrinis sp.]|nr:DUF3093 domain-containing protein [Actinocrinis sp.]
MDTADEPTTRTHTATEPAPGEEQPGSHTAPGPARTTYSETLRAPLSWYFIAFLGGLSLAIIVLVMSPWWSLAALVGGTAVFCWAVAAYGRPVIEVSGGRLTAGRATLPAAALGPATALGAEKARALRTFEADPRAFLLLRSYISTAVRVEVADPGDPTPYLYLSSRKPGQLAAAVNALAR